MRNHSLAKKLAAAGMLAVLGIASVGTVVSFAAGTVTTTEEKPENPEHDGRYMGKIAEINSSSITIEMMGGPMGRGPKPDGAPEGEGFEKKGTPPELPTNADGTAMTPPERPANNDGSFTPPEPPKNEDGTIMTPPDNGQAPDGMHGTMAMTFTTSTSYASDFAVGDMVEILSSDGKKADGVSAAEKPEKKDGE